MQHDMQVISGNKEEGDSDHSQERMARVLMRIRNLMCKHRSHGTHCSTRPHVLYPRIRPRLPLPLHSPKPLVTPPSSLPPSLPSFLLPPRKRFLTRSKSLILLSTDVAENKLQTPLPCNNDNDGRLLLSKAMDLFITTIFLTHSQN